MAEADATTDGWHRVCLNTIVRKEKVLDSERLRILPMGSRVNVVEKSGRRVRIDQPISGWCSLNSSNGDTILKPLDGNQKVAPTPRGGQAAVNTLQTRVASAQQQIDEAQKAGKDVHVLKLEKEQLEARIENLKQQNEQQQKVFEDWKKQAELTQDTTAVGTVPTDMQNIAFRNGDCVLLASQCALEGIVVVRCVAKNAAGDEIIGCDYNSHVGPENAALQTDGKLEGEQKWKVGKGMTGVWLKRTDFKSLVPTYALMVETDKIQQKNTDLQIYEQTTKGMIKLVKKYTAAFKLFAELHHVKEDGTKEVHVGEEYGNAFFNSFKGLEVGE